MGITGKYNFSGIKKFGAAGLELLISGSSAFGAALMKIPVLSSIIDFLLQQAVNYMANMGLVVINVGAIIVEGHFDQQAFDDAMDKALASVDASKGSLTDSQKKAIDEKVIQAFRKFAPVQPS